MALYTLYCTRLRLEGMVLEADDSYSMHAVVGVVMFDDVGALVPPTGCDDSTAYIESLISTEPLVMGDTVADIRAKALDQLTLNYTFLTAEDTVTPVWVDAIA